MAPRCFISQKSRDLLQRKRIRKSADMCRVGNTHRMLKQEAGKGRRGQDKAINLTTLFNIHDGTTLVAANEYQSYPRVSRHIHWVVFTSHLPASRSSIAAIMNDASSSENRGLAEPTMSALSSTDTSEEKAGRRTRNNKPTIMLSVLKAADLLRIQAQATAASRLSRSRGDEVGIATRVYCAERTAPGPNFTSRVPKSLMPDGGQTEINYKVVSVIGIRLVNNH